METVCIKMKIKQGAMEDVREWFQTLRHSSEEVLQSLENEDVVVESVFLDKQDNDYYLIYYMKARSLQHARDVAAQSSLAIDKYHKQCLKAFCEDRRHLELLMDFYRISEKN